jgi:alanine dehydrogenase
MDISLDRLRHLDEVMPPNVVTVYSDPHAVARHAAKADLVIGAVLIPGAKAPQLINREMLVKMKRGSALVDVCIDQGGCAETSRPTTHSDPVFVVDGVVHYCVANMPGAVGRTSSHALCNATLPYCRELAGMGLKNFVKKDEGRAAGLNMKEGRILHPAVIEAFPDLAH